MRVPPAQRLWIGLSLFLAHIPVFSPLSVSLLRLLHFLALPRSTVLSVFGVIVAVMTYLALSSAPSNTNPRTDESEHRDADVQTQHQADTPLPSHCLAPLLRRTDSEQSAKAGRRLHSLLPLPSSLH